MLAAHYLEHFGPCAETKLTRAATKPNKFGKKLDNLGANREDRMILMHRFTPVKTIPVRPNNQATTLAVLLVFMLLHCACSSSEPVKAGMFSPPQSLSGTATPATARSLSSMEAISRGVAAVTPPGAALKDVYYQFDSVDLEDEAIEVLKKNAEWMKANPKARVEVEGHCDDVGSAEYNLALGAKRAQTAKDFLVSQGIATERLVTISYGKEAPACFELTEECRVRNRRARFVMFTELPTS
jgi:peptidoglycan-associated lipoprotein